MTSTGLPYCPPDPGVLLNSPGRSWDYQVSTGMKTVLREEVREHFRHYINRNLDKSTIPLYLLLSGAGTGKSRNAAELSGTAYRCFDGTYFEEKNEELANFLRDPFIFHVSFENGSSVQTEESDPWRAIGSRMILQVLRGSEVKPEEKITIGHINSVWGPPTPDEVITLLAKRDASTALAKRAVFLIIDGLHHIGEIFGEIKMNQTLTQLGGLAHRGFILICATSTISGPIDKIMKGSRRRRILLPCSPLKPPRINSKQVFNADSLAKEVLIDDCGGHGRALELLLKVFDLDIGSEVKSIVTGLQGMYRGALPQSKEAVAIVKAVLANRCLARDENIPGTQITPDQICQNGLIRFDLNNPDSDNLSGYLNIPYLWLLAICATYQGDLFEELQLLDYRELKAKEDDTIPGGFSWSDFEKIMIKIRKVKSHVFNDGDNVTIGQLHRGAVMDQETANISFLNRHLRDDVAVHKISTKTNRSNERSWLIETTNSGHLDLRGHEHIIRNAPNASAADAVLSLDSEPPRAETHQYKHVKSGRLDFRKEHGKAAGDNDIFVLFCTSSVPSLRNGQSYNVPPGTLLVTEENWNQYFGPYAGRSYLVAKKILGKRTHGELEEETDDLPPKAPRCS